ncbi:Aldose 1-epimerase [Amphibalanus amphitrite]|uniref:Galactose mutarotase n=1 Tax=Amphibalanus amphitrite TaxID=1232801 RepID=A0A6A4VJE7_AMPAM|nr:Aldose 1-epimerase [Amphibalanus amphitrite]
MAGAMTTVAEDNFGVFRTANTSQPVRRFTLSNSAGTEAQVINYGARLTSLKVRGRSGQPVDVVLGEDTYDGYLAATSRFFGCTVGRVANRIAGPPSGTWPGHGAGRDALLRHQVTINADTVLEVDDACLVTGRRLPVADSAFDFRLPRPLGEAMAAAPGGGFDHNFCLERPEDGAVGAAAAVHSADTGIAMEVFTDQPGLQFYTGNFLPADGASGKAGATYSRQGAFCMETQNSAMAGLGDLNMANPVFVTYLFYAAVLGLKTLFMSLFTARHRMGNKVFANPEDAKGLQGKVKFDHPDVERVRRAHLNDLENVLPFLILCPLYLATGPAAATGHHPHQGVPQPSRALCFMVGIGVTVYMCVQILLATM